jgi:hypothetical protein
VYAHNTCPYSRVALDGILLCEAYGRCRGYELRCGHRRARHQVGARPEAGFLGVGDCGRAHRDRGAGRRCRPPISAQLRAAGLTHALKSFYELAVENLTRWDRPMLFGAACCGVAE